MRPIILSFLMALAIVGAASAETFRQCKARTTRAAAIDMVMLDFSNWKKRVDDARDCERLATKKDRKALEWINGIREQMRREAAHGTFIGF